MCTVIVTLYVMYFKLRFYHCYFMSWIDSVSSVTASSFDFYPLYCLFENGRVSGQNM
jgi:hypothetical protein